MNLKDILAESDFLIIQGILDKEINKIAYDSRKVENSTLFVCIKGEKTDGHKYVEQAISNGATALLVENDVDINFENVTVIKVKNSRESLSNISNVFFNKPSEKINVIGVTGTNGKTSISFLVSEIINRMNKNVGVIGTLGMQINKKPLDMEKTTPTTPDSLEIQEILSEMIKQDVTDVVMEVTSIALEQSRVENCKINIGIFTNLTEDHLDFHQTMDNYKEAKKKLFEMCEVAIINIDDKAGIEYANLIKKRKRMNKNIQLITYGINNTADLQAINVVLMPNKTLFDLSINNKVYNFEINLPGMFNVYNVLAAIATALNSKVPVEAIESTLKEIKGARGRFESLEAPNGFSVVVDYAHTPDALENVLKTAKEFKPKNIITVFGCGGDRDRTKRPLMGEISGFLSNKTIITSDNPRTENPKEIIKEIEVGIKQTKGLYEIEIDREEAIKKAIYIATEGDIVIIAGKGHETYQILLDKTIHFDDMEIVQKYI